MPEYTPQSSTESNPADMPSLRVSQGENKGEVFKLQTETTLGRERDNAVVLLDTKVSRYHAKISFVDGRWIITDLGSANGTLVNGTPITGPATLTSNDQISIGETVLVFTLASQPKAVTAPHRVPVAPAPSPPADQPSRRIQPRLAWIAGGLILFLCFAAVFVLYIAVGRTGGGAPAVAGDATSAGTDASDTSQGQSDSPPSGSELVPEEFVLVYEDDFSDSFGGWDDAFDTYTRKVYGNNRYQIEVNASNLVAWGLANRNVADFVMEVEAKLEDGDEKNSYGLIFRFEDRNNFYRFDISGDGYYLFSKFIDGEWTTLIDWTASEAINTGSAANILKVTAVGPDITLAANGQELTNITDDSLATGNFGFFAGTFAEPFAWVSYDNLKLWTPPNTELTLIPTATRPGVPLAQADSAAQANTESQVAAAATATATPVPTPTSETDQVEEDELKATAEATEEVLETAEATEEALDSAATDEPSPEATEEPTPTPVPLPEYASRDQTLARGEERAEGRIVYPVYDPERGTYDIYIADIADGGNRNLLQADASQPALTQDGSELAYRSWQADRRGLFARGLTEEDDAAWGFDLFFEAARPQFSPADQSLMYHSRTSGREPATYRVIDGVSEVMRRDGFPIQGRSPKWAPDGQQFVYSSCLGATCGIVLSDINGGAPNQLTDHPTDTNPEISPDGQTVVFMSERGGNWEIYRVDITGENLEALTSDSASDGLPTWSPDGSKIAFVSNRDGEWSIWDMNPDGSNKRRHFVIDGSVDGVVQHDVTNSFGWVEENIDWIP